MDAFLQTRHQRGWPFDGHVLLDALRRCLLYALARTTVVGQFELSSQKKLPSRPAQKKMSPGFWRVPAVSCFTDL